MPQPGLFKPVVNDSRVLNYPIYWGLSSSNRRTPINQPGSNGMIEFWTLLRSKFWTYKLRSGLPDSKWFLTTNSHIFSHAAPRSLSPTGLTFWIPTSWPHGLMQQKGVEISNPRDSLRILGLYLSIFWVYYGSGSGNDHESELNAGTNGGFPNWTQMHPSVIFIKMKFGYHKLEDHPEPEP